MTRDKQKTGRDKEVSEIWAILHATSKLLQEHIEESKERAKERAKQDKERAEQDKERAKRIDKQLEELGKQIGGAHNRWGKIVEGLVAGDLTEIISSCLHAQAHHISTRVYATDHSWEIDILATNGDIAVPVEVKTTLGKDDIERFVNRILLPFATLMPDHKHKRIHGLIAFVKVNEKEHDVVEYALQQGLVVVKAMHGTNKVLNAKDFVPRDFCSR